MTPALELLRDLHSRGVRLEPDGDRLCYSAPLGVLTADLKARMAAEKTVILAALRDPCRAAYRVWEAALGEVADEWDRHAAEARGAGRDPQSMDDALLTADVRAAIQARDLPQALDAVDAWRQAWGDLMARRPDRLPTGRERQRTP